MTKYDGQSYIPLPVRTNNSRKTKEKGKDASDDKTVGVLVVTGHLLKVTEENGKQRELDGEKEKSDPVKEPAERPTADDEEQEKVQRDGLKLQLEKEKMLRSEAEAQLREVHLESERCKARLTSLQEDFSKMEEMVCNLLQFKSRIEQLKHEKSSITLAYEGKIRKYQSCIASLEKENFMLLNELRSLQTQKNKDHQEEWEHSLSWLLLERLRLLEQENSSLVLENEQQRLQYEHCLDDVANQVVQALLTQKGLREECSKLQRRVQDLERQNHTLTLMFRQCLFHTSENSEQSGNDSLSSTWLKSPNTETHEDSWFESSQVNRNLHHDPSHDSPSHNSQSEDSTESLASMCSDYSTHSGSSGGNPKMSYPGFPKMSSPPQWLRERSLHGQGKPTVANICPISYSKSVSYLPSGSGQSKSKPDASRFSWQEPSHILTSESRQLENGSNYPLCDNSQFRLSKERSFTMKTMEDKFPKMDCEWDRFIKKDFPRKPICDINSLDAMDTPIDECFSADSLSLLSSSQRLLVSSQYRPIHNICASRNDSKIGGLNQQTKSMLPNSNLSSVLSFTENLTNSAGQNNCVCRTTSDIPTVVTTGISVPRPTTLNIIPHIMGDPAHNFSFPALECKSHVINECGNVYEDIDAPLFPETEHVNSNCSTVSDLCDKDGILTNHIGSSSEEGEIAMNTVIRKPHVVNTTSQVDSQSTKVQSTGQQPKIPARELPPTPITNFNSDKISDSGQDWESSNQTIVLQSSVSDSPVKNPAMNGVTFPIPNVTTLEESNSPLSVVGEHGNKDEGYSTMSSDVQDVSTDCVPHLRQSYVSPLPTHSPNCKSLPDLSEDQESNLCSLENCVQKSVQNLQPLSEDIEEEEVWSGFERDLDNSLVRTDKSGSLTDNTCDKKDDVTKIAKHEHTEESEVQTECIDPTCISGESILPTKSDESSLNQSVKSRILPAYDKILSLLMPQGFKSHRNDPRRVTLPFVQYSETLGDGTYPPTKQRTQTAEKGTITEPDCPDQSIVTEVLRRSDVSLSTVGSIDRIKTIKSNFENKDNLHVHFRKKGVRKSTISDSCIVYKEVNVRPKSTISSHDMECYRLERRRCRHRKSDHHCSWCQEYCSVQNHRDCVCNGNLARTLSDSHLYVRELFLPAFELSCFCNKHPATRFNLIPLECHTSACDLTSPSRLTPPLRRSQRQVLVTDDVPSSDRKHQEALIQEEDIWKINSQCSPSVSLSSIHSSTSGEIGCAEDDEEFGATSLKCSRDPDLSSESEDECDLLEHHTFVEEWLQREGPQLSKSQNVYTYDEEEVGNWSLQLIDEDMRNIESNNDMWDGSWNHSQDKQIQERPYIHQLERIQETSLEEEFQEESWNSTLWDTSKTDNTVPLESEATSNIEETQPIDEDDINNEEKVTEQEEEHVGDAPSDDVPHPVLEDNSDTKDTNSVPVEECDCKNNVSISVQCSDLNLNKDEFCVTTISEEKNEFNSFQCEATEFNRDFYRLCTVGSTRSLVTSESGSHADADQQQEQCCSDQNQNGLAEQSSLPIEKCESPSLEQLSAEKCTLSSTEPQPSEIETTVLTEDMEELDELDKAKDQISADISENSVASVELKCQIIPQRTKNESHEKTVNTEEKIPPPIPIKKNKLRTKVSEVKNGIAYTERHPYSRITIDKLYVHERTKLTAASKKLTPERRRKSATKVGYTSKTKLQNSEDHSKKLHKNDLNHSSAKGASINKKVNRQFTKSMHHSGIISNSNKGVVTENDRTPKLVKSIEEKEKREIRLKSQSPNNISQMKTRYIKHSEISGMSEKDGLDLEKRLAGEGGHMSVAAKIQELNALLVKTEKDTPSPPLQKVKSKKVVIAERKDSVTEKRNHVQNKESAAIKKNGIKEGCGTSWVHVEADIDLSDPKARANLLDSMMASSSSSSSSSGTEDEGEVLEHKHHQRLHALHRFRRHKKRATDKDAVISFIPRIRTSIIDRHDFYFRYGEKEREAVACFDFLDDMSTSPSDVGSCELLENNNNNNNINHTIYAYSDNVTKPNRLSLDDSKLPFYRRHVSENHYSSTTLNSQDGEIIDHISLSDSCAESYTSSTHSLNRII